MRLRNVRSAYDEIELSDQVIKHPETLKGKWRELFGNDYPIHIEIGMGKGQFLVNQAKVNPSINYIGFEKFTVVLAKALKKIQKEQLTNLHVVRIDAEELLSLFDLDEVDGIYLNFSDPWPKERHDKRRLTHHLFLEKYKQILKKGSQIIMKTDNRMLFEFSLEQMKQQNIVIETVTYDLYNSPYLEGNIATEYEEKFAAASKPIHMLKAIV